MTNAVSVSVLVTSDAVEVAIIAADVTVVVSGPSPLMSAGPSRSSRTVRWCFLYCIVAQGDTVLVVQGAVLEVVVWANAKARAYNV